MNNIYNDRVKELGFLDKEIDPSVDLFQEIEKLKKEKNAIILAHYFSIFMYRFEIPIMRWQPF